MSTDLYGVRILAVDKPNRKVRLQLIVTYYDVSSRYHEPLLKDITGFFRVLADNSIGGYGDSPLAKEVTTDEYCDEKWVKANAHRYIQKIELLGKKNQPLRAYKGLSDFYYLRDGQWKDEERLVQGQYEITVTDEKYLAHLKEGYAWGTTAYDDYGFLYYRAATAENLPDMYNGYRLGHELLAGKAEEPFFLRSLHAGTQADNFYILGMRRGEGLELLTIDLATKELTLRLVGLDYDALKASGLSIGNETLWFSHYKINKVWQTAAIPPKLKPKYLISDNAKYFADITAKKLQFFDQNNKKLWHIELEKSVRHAAFSPNEKLVALTAETGYIAIWDLEKQVETRRLASSETLGHVGHFSFSPDGRYFMWRQAYSILHICELSTGEVVLTYRRPERKESIAGMIWSLDGKFLLMMVENERRDAESEDLIIFPVG